MIRFTILAILSVFLFFTDAFGQFGNACLPFDSSACYNVQPFPPVNFSIAKKYSSAQNTTIYHAPLVIDVTGDCVPELLMPATTNFTNGTNSSGIRLTSGIRILNSLNGQTLINMPTAMFAWTAASSFVAADVNNDGQVEIIIAAADHTSNPLDQRGKLICYNTAGTILWISDQQFGQNVTYRYGGTPALADFNQDGIPEVYIYNEIFNAQTGVKLCAGGNNGVGKQLDAQLFGTISVTIAGQFDDDLNDLELAAGYSCYKVNITNPSGLAGNTMTAMNIQIAGQNRDGYTSFGDINQDGKLDIIVSSTANTSQVGLYVYTITGNTANLLASAVLPSGGGVMPDEIGPAFVGDIDGSGVPSIGVTRPYRLLAYKYNGTTTLQQFWQLITNDFSGQTGMTIFDFNQDGVQEIVYRDETSLRIMNGSVSPPTNIITFPCFSGTGLEHPVVADIDNTGEAKICVPCGTSNTGAGSYQGVLDVFSAALNGDPWAPARGIWNQYQYHVFNIDDDLTIPQVQLNNANYANDFFNNFYVQTSWVNENGEYLWGVADLQVNFECLELDPNSNNYNVSFEVANSDVASFATSQNFTISLFDGNPETGGAFIDDIEVVEVLEPGDVLDDLSFSVPSASISNGQFYLVINLDPNYVVGQPIDESSFVLEECSYANNISSITLPQSLAYSDTLCVGQTVTYHGQSFDQTGQYNFVVSNIQGCDSLLVSVDITTFQNFEYDTLQIETCNSFVWMGQTYLTSGIYTELVSNLDFCVDSIYTLILNIDQPVNEQIISTCDSLLFNGVLYTSNASVTINYPNPNSLCDSVVNTTIEIFQSTFDSLLISSCEPYMWGGNLLEESGFYDVIGTNAQGCPEYLHLNLTISESFTSSETITNCGNLAWGNQVISTSGTYEQVFPTANGCDSAIILNATIYPIHAIELIRYTCDPTDVLSETLYLTNIHGCDSTVLIQPVQYPENLRPVANFLVNPNPIDITALGNISIINLSTNFDSCFWSIPSIPFYSSEFTPTGFNFTDIGNYEITLVVVNELGCIDSLTLVLYVGEDLTMYVPNTFTPDGNDFNGIFIPVFSGNWEGYNYELMIFNRWGELIFESHHPLIGWDGTYLGKPVPDGTYVWKIKFNSEILTNTKEIFGHVNVLR